MGKPLKPCAQKVLAFIINHGSITGQDAIQRLHMTEVRSRISELKKAGYPIDYVWERHKNDDGSYGRHKRFFIKEEKNDAAAS